ncbi:hypothetical protein KI688_002349 [Linnemannia hyalina]|uniref:DNA 3'-5' helicase n=1 Tax=Linnemannia hyalina TaxID=64524 RepID=A0A9P7XQ43_9FUNG|nr:hypothetical protein KI688_002349 [Linnemannia hyalina]
MREQQEKLQVSGFKAICLDSSQAIDVGLLRRSWGKDSRKAYARLGEFRGIAPAHVAFVAMSATLPGPILREMKQSIGFYNNIPVYNVGNNRPNVRLEEVRNYLWNLRSRVADDEQDIIKSFHSLYSDEYKSTSLQHFREGRIKILLSTETAGMECDINNVVRVIQFKEPSTISCLVQRFDRAARDVSMQGHAILLASHRNKARRRTDKANRGNNNMDFQRRPGYQNVYRDYSLSTAGP